jgi:hypothetical protein
MHIYAFRPSSALLLARFLSISEKTTPFHFHPQKLSQIEARNMTDPRTGSRWILGDKLDQVYPHLGSIDNLWLKKWKFPSERSLYP